MAQINFSAVECQFRMAQESVGRSFTNCWVSWSRLPLNGARTIADTVIFFSHFCPVHPRSSRRRSPPHFCLFLSSLNTFYGQLLSATVVFTSFSYFLFVIEFLITECIGREGAGEVSVTFYVIPRLAMEFPHGRLFSPFFSPCVACLCF